MILASCCCCFCFSSTWLSSKPSTNNHAVLWLQHTNRRHFEMADEVKGHTAFACKYGVEEGLLYTPEGASGPYRGVGKGSARWRAGGGKGRGWFQWTGFGSYIKEAAGDDIRETFLFFFFWFGYPAYHGSVASDFSTTRCLKKNISAYSRETKQERRMESSSLSFPIIRSDVMACAWTRKGPP